MRSRSPDAVPPGFPIGLVREITLLDGRRVDVRPILASDEPELRRAVQRADPETLRRRFLGGRPPLHDADYQRLVTVDYDRRLAIVAFAPDGQGIGIARYEALDDQTAEVAVVVEQDWRHVGLATALMGVLAEGAVLNGIRHFSAEFFADNLDVADLVTESGLGVRRSEDEAGVVSVDVALPSRIEPAP